MLSKGLFSGISFVGGLHTHVEKQHNQCQKNQHADEPPNDGVGLFLLLRLSFGTTHFAFLTHRFLSLGPFLFPEKWEGEGRG